MEVFSGKPKGRCHEGSKGGTAVRCPEAAPTLRANLVTTELV